jgi:two-component system, NarL family, sensor histidine kinase DegS
VSLDVQLGVQQAALLLRDDGTGFDPDEMEGGETELDQRRFGLRGIRERVELVSGQMALHSSPQQGTELWVSVPKKPTRLVTGDWLALQGSKGQ